MNLDTFQEPTARNPVVAVLYLDNLEDIHASWTEAL
jgi:hypothetical protein